MFRHEAHMKASTLGGEVEGLPEAVSSKSSPEG